VEARRWRRRAPRVTLTLAALLALVVSAVAVPRGAPAHADAAGAGGNFVPIAGKTVLLDTRSGIGAAKGVRGAASTTTVFALGVGGVPSTGVSAVLVRVAALKPTANTWLEVWPDGIARPVMTTLAAGKGEQISGLAVVKVGADGKISVFNNGGNTDIVVEAQGYFTSNQGSTGGGYVPLGSYLLTPMASPQVPAGGSVTVTVPSNLVPAGSAAVMVDLTVSNGRCVVPPSGGDCSFMAGTLSGGPVGGSSHPLLNYGSGKTHSGAVIALPASGKVTISNSGPNPVFLTVVTEGYFAADTATGAGLRLAPTRLVNTRSVGAGQPVPANGTIDVPVGGANGLPTRGIAGAVLNVMVTPTADGTLDVSGAPSSVTFEAGIWRTNMVVVKPGPDGMVHIRNLSSGTAHIIVDLEGWYADPLPGVPVAQNTRITVLQDAPLLAGGAGALEYGYVDNSGNVRWGHQDNLDSIGSIQWTVISAGERFSGPPALAQLSDGRLQVSAQFRDSNISSDAETAPGGPAWNAWGNIGGSMASAPVVGTLADTNKTIVQFAVDADGQLWAYPQTGSLPHWQDLGDQDLTATLTVIRVSDGLRVFGLNSQGAVKTIEYYNDGTVSAWADLGGTGLSGTPAVVARPGYQLQVFVTSASGTVVSKTQDSNGVWPADWQTIGTVDPNSPVPAVQGSPAAVINPATGRGLVEVRGTDDQLYQVAESATQFNVWGNWTKTVEGSAPVSTDPTLVAYTNVNSVNHTSLLIVCQDGNGAPIFYLPA
jgi:hypothetical protein